jgi:hypothetical protein
MSVKGRRNVAAVELLRQKIVKIAKNFIQTEPMW